MESTTNQSGQSKSAPSSPSPSSSSTTHHQTLADADATTARLEAALAQAKTLAAGTRDLLVRVEREYTLWRLEMGEERSVGLGRVPVRLCGKERWWEGVGELMEVLEEEEERKGEERKEEGM